MIDQFRAKTMAKDEAVRGVFGLQQCDITALPLPLETDSFDVIIITQVLHHLSDGQDEHAPVYALMEELGRGCAPTAASCGARHKHRRSMLKMASGGVR